jgi:hypothetical protein
MDTARPLNCRTRVECVDGELVLWRRVGSLATGCFLLFWLSFWTIGCVALVGLVAREPTVEHLLFATPFLSSWVFVAFLLVWMLRGYECLRIGPDGLRLRSGALVPLGERRVPLGELMGVGYFSKVTDTETGATEFGLTIATVGRPVRFARGIEPMEGRWLAEQVHRHLQTLIRDRAVELRQEETSKPAVRVEVLGPDKVVAGPPSDSVIRKPDEWDGTVFVRRGTFSLAALGGVTFVALFWNGVVGVFVLQLLKEFQWFLFVFLIPFEVIGFSMFLGWLAVLTAPSRVERWTVSPGEISVRFSVLGLGRTRRYESDRLGRIELRRIGGNTKAGPGWQGHEGDTPYSLGLVGREGQDLLVIGGLTEGEARWMGGEWCRLLQDRLPKGMPLPVSSDLWDWELDR